MEIGIVFTKITNFFDYINMPFANPTPYDYFPRRLHPQEIGNPYNVINLFFGWENFLAWRAHLDEWKEATLLPGYQMDSEQTLQTFIRYEYLVILINIYRISAHIFLASLILVTLPFLADLSASRIFLTNSGSYWLAGCVISNSIFSALAKALTAANCSLVLG